jgi:hypothetical protein
MATPHHIYENRIFSGLGHRKKHESDPINQSLMYQYCNSNQSETQIRLVNLLSKEEIKLTRRNTLNCLKSGYFSGWTNSASQISKA